MDLDTEKRPGLRLLDDSGGHQVYVQFNREEIEVPYANVADKVPMDSANLKMLFDDAFKEDKKAILKPVAAPVVEKLKPGPKPKFTAQYDTPMAHVHAGPGAGKVRD